jgi:hypothetical protein
MVGVDAGCLTDALKPVLALIQAGHERAKSKQAQPPEARLGAAVELRAKPSRLIPNDGGRLSQQQ